MFFLDLGASGLDKAYEFFRMVLESIKGTGKNFPSDRLWDDQCLSVKDSSATPGK